MRRAIGAALFAAIALLPAGARPAESEGVLNKLLAPGPLMKGHADLEDSDCLKCHDAGKGVPDERCLECHKAIRPFVEQKRGFHGLASKSCRECHNDHKGRAYDSIAVDAANFDHGGLTGYKLEGKHAEIKCRDCHKDAYGEKSAKQGQTRYIGKQASCASCHKKDDPHFFIGALARRDCNACHGLKAWKKDLSFSHERDGHFKLEGKHAELKCVDCHGPNKLIKAPVYKWPTMQKQKCLACHQDFHKGNLSARFRGGNCVACHSQSAWEIKSFDHSATDYELRGKHADLQCVDCHKQKTPQAELKRFNFAGLRRSCLACHKDYHLFGSAKSKKFGSLSQCSACHGEASWKQARNFEHERDSHYPLDGKHADLKCNDCHVPKNLRLTTGIYRWPQLKGKDCETCHANPHLKDFSAALLKKRCVTCHVTTGWFDIKGGKAFDHSKARFQLDGAHAHASCSECHGTQKTKRFKFKSLALKFCVDCHTNIHRSQLSTRAGTDACASCHTTKDFKQRLPFDHAQTRYPLKGAHATLKCEECHKKSGATIMLQRPNVSSKAFPQGAQLELAQFLFPRMRANDCRACHADYHDGQLGNQCVGCHSERAWKPVRFNHNEQSSFKLSGKHEQAKCSACHKPERGAFTALAGKQVPVIRYKPLGKLCVECHEDPHKGAFGRACQECHGESDWKRTRDFHKNFALSGIHYMMACSECHKDGRKLSGLSHSCVTCHAKDDVHVGTLPHCEDCHRQHFWEVSDFKHSLTLFPLRGAHRTLDCVQCHQNGTYKGLNAACSSCHINDAPQSTPPFAHSPIGAFLSCDDCHHNQFTWITH
jgi:hypothetical protein